MKDVEQKKIEEKKVVPVTIPEGKFAYVCCGSCKFGDYDSRKEMVWCGKFRSWQDRSDSCSHGEEG